jgi:hypothetical protein
MEKPTPETWARKREEAMTLIESRREIPRVLLEISSQHNLVNGKPNEEYVLRLERGIELYHVFLGQGLSVEILTLGSVHKPDTVSLTEAGERYLRERGVPSKILRGEELIERYKGKNAPWPGIYNSADEAFVAASYFKDEGFGQLHSIAGSAQAHRKALHYLWFGVLPQMHGIPSPNAHHDFLKEAADYFPFVLGVDPGHQESDSPAAGRSRRERQP